MMKRTKAEEKRLSEITDELISDMTSIGIEPGAYKIAIRMAAETLFEREQAYMDYIEDGARQVNDKGAANPYTVRFQAWNNQARSCLYMLKLTPTPSQNNDNSASESE